MYKSFHLCESIILLTAGGPPAVSNIMVRELIYHSSVFQGMIRDLNRQKELIKPKKLHECYNITIFTVCVTSCVVYIIGHLKI